ncbi:MAG: hypothetical protein ACHQT8_01855 [Chlamydiales bacterium]
MMKRVLAAFLASGTLSALPIEPWLGNQYEFFFDTSYTFDYYDRVKNALGGEKHKSRDNQFLFGLGYTVSPRIETYVEMELARTTRQEFNWRSFAFQSRYLWLDDVSGDPLALVTGVSLRGVNHLSLKDISCPYAAEFDAELNLSMGKEWSCGEFWTLHTYGFGAAGIGQRGAPWTRFLLSCEWNWVDRHQLQLFGRGDFGFGKQNFVNVDHFHGYAKVHHQSIDIGASYRRMFRIWGTLSFEYARRVYAHAYPAEVNFFTLAYELPFSFF